jgi:hypothetical protein
MRSDKSNSVKFYREFCNKSCRVEAHYVNDEQWRVLVVGDFIPTEDDILVSPAALYAMVDRIFANWVMVAKTKVHSIWYDLGGY